MARPYRLLGENCLYHIMSRGDDRKRIYASPADYNRFLDYIVKAKERYRFYLYAYCLMPNHFHLLIETQLPNISRVMHYLKGSYTTYYNIRHQRCGHLFQGRFKSLLAEKDNYLLELSRYIHLNPVRAGIVKDPREYTWSSYVGYLEHKDEYLDTVEIKRCISLSRNEYQRFVMEGIRNPTDCLSQAYAGILLGSVGFIKDKLKDLKSQIANPEVANRKALSNDQERAEEIIHSVTRYYSTTLEVLRNSKSRPLRRKQILIYLLRGFTGLTNQEIGNIVGMSYYAVCKAGILIEELIKKDKNMQRTIKKLVSSFKV